jgi:hypothetical protein
MGETGAERKVLTVIKLQREAEALILVTPAVPGARCNVGFEPVI